MAAFPLCAACAAEYADPADRRYHAQPVSCHDCGPVLSFHRPGGATRHREDALAATVAALAAGQIVAVKGIGGYHLACDATSGAAVRRLRDRKHRPDRPFAVMVADLAAADTIIEVPDRAAAALTAPERPILLLPARADGPVSADVAPGLDELGVMLAYAPLHHLLVADLAALTRRTPVLVMTSGNLAREPLSYRDADARDRLGPIADAFLSHDREIAVPVEDSVLAWPAAGEVPVPVRRSRGYAPLPVDLGAGAPPPGGGAVLAAGAELKNTVALAIDGRAFVSAHVGDLESLAARESHQRVTDQLLAFHRRTPALVVADRHPGYASRAWAHRYAAAHGVPVHEVQHHHAHLAALAAEHGRLDQPLLGLVFDGTGYGCDATVWGGELLLLRDDATAADRLGRLGDVRLPGGDAGVRNPCRTAALALTAAGVPIDATPVAAALTAAEARLMGGVADSGIGSVPTSSVGRLFDVVASVIGVRQRISYEAQAAVELEAAGRAWLRAHPDDVLPALQLPIAERDGLLVWEPEPLVRGLVVHLDAGPGALSAAFHRTLGIAAADAAARAAAATGVRTVGLSGGVYVNRLLLDATVAALRDRGLIPLTHRLVPANDGGLALGQAAVGSRVLARPPTLDTATPEPSD